MAQNTFPITLWLNADGTPLANGFLLVHLDSDVQSPAGELDGGRTVRLSLDANGGVKYSPLFWANTDLQPSGSTYWVRAYNALGQHVYGPAAVTVVDSGVTPVASLVLANTSGGNSTLTVVNGTLTLTSGGTSPQTVKLIDTVDASVWSLTVNLGTLTPASTTGTGVSAVELTDTVDGTLWTLTVQAGTIVLTDLTAVANFALLDDGIGNVWIFTMQSGTPTLRVYGGDALTQRIGLVDTVDGTVWTLNVESGGLVPRRGAHIGAAVFRIRDAVDGTLWNLRMTAGELVWTES